MESDRDLWQLANRVGEKLRASALRAATAESCTGGWIAKAITDVPGSSAWFEGGFVTYSNAAKRRDLGVLAKTLELHGAVSEAVAREMAQGALDVSGADVAVSVSGVAGPDGGSELKPVGTVWFGIARRSADPKIFAEHHLFPGDRESIRRRAVGRALELLLEV